MEACEVCSGHDAVMWSLKDGHICMSCEEKQRAKFELIRLEEENAAFRATLEWMACQPKCPFSVSASAVLQKWAKVEGRT